MRHRPTQFPALTRLPPINHESPEQWLPPHSYCTQHTPTCASPSTPITLFPPSLRVLIDPPLQALLYSSIPHLPVPIRPSPLPPPYSSPITLACAFPFTQLHPASVPPPQHHHLYPNNTTHYHNITSHTLHSTTTTAIILPFLPSNSPHHQHHHYICHSSSLTFHPAPSHYKHHHHCHHQSTKPSQSLSHSLPNRNHHPNYHNQIPSLILNPTTASKPAFNPSILTQHSPLHFSPASSPPRQVIAPLCSAAPPFQHHAQYGALFSVPLFS